MAGTLHCVVPRVYVCPRAVAPFLGSGRLDTPFWEGANWTDDFVDIQGEHMPKPRFRTRAKMLWDDECLYIGAELEEPHVWATLTQRDSVIFHDNDFEVFIDPDGDNHVYAELEFNPLNTVFDLLLVRPYRDGGPALHGWDVNGLRSAVNIVGSLNDPSDEDSGWSLEVAIPWTGISDLSRRPLPPSIGEQWRINFSRVQWQHSVIDGAYRKVPDTPEDNWVWSPQGVIDMHCPESWGILQFAETAQDAILPYAGENERRSLMAFYHAQRAFRAAHGRWALAGEMPDQDPKVDLKTTGGQWQATLNGYRIDHESKLERM